MGSLSDVFALRRALFPFVWKNFVIQATGQAEGRAMAALAEAKYARESVLKADRGTIVDRNGELIAADTLSYKMIIILDEKASKGSKTPRHV